MPVKEFGGVFSVGGVLYWSVSTLRPSGSTLVVTVTPPSGGMTVVRSPLYTAVAVDTATPELALVSITTRPRPSYVYMCCIGIAGGGVIWSGATSVVSG